MPSPETPAKRTTAESITRRPEGSAVSAVEPSIPQSPFRLLAGTEAAPPGGALAGGPAALGVTMAPVQCLANEPHQSSIAGSGITATHKEVVCFRDLPRAPG